MDEKITLEHFLKIKNQLSNLISHFDDEVRIHKDDKDFNKEEFEQKYIKEYFELQKELTSYDLSDIPFEAWDVFQILSSPTQVFLTDNFDKKFKNKYYSCNLSITDLVTLSDEQLEELKEKNVIEHLNHSDRNSNLLAALGIDKLLELYNYSVQEYEDLNKLYSGSLFSGIRGFRTGILDFTAFSQRARNLDVEDIKSWCFDYAKKAIINSQENILLNEYPESFINENPELFLSNIDVPEEVKERYFKRELRLKDLINYPGIFQKLPIKNFMHTNFFIPYVISNNYGMEEFQKLIQKYPKVFEHLEEKGIYNRIFMDIKDAGSLEKTLFRAIKDYCASNFDLEDMRISEWLLSLNFKYVKRINTIDELLGYNEHVFVLDDYQRKVIELLGINNIRRFEQETGFFSYRKNIDSPKLEMFDLFRTYFVRNAVDSLEQKGIDFKDGNLSYDEFVDEMAKSLEDMRIRNYFQDYSDYDWIQGDFRDKHPEIFIDFNAPIEFKNAFYKNKITPAFLNKNKEFIPYLLNKDLFDILKVNMRLEVPDGWDEIGEITTKWVDFVEEYVSIYGNEKTLNLISKYGNVLDELVVPCLENELENEEKFEKTIRKEIYNKIIEENPKYRYLSIIPEMVLEYPELFVNFNNLSSIPKLVREKLTDAFYDGKMEFYYIRNYPELIEVLKDKNLFLAFVKKDRFEYGLSFQKKKKELEIIEVLGNENFLQLCARYGRYMDGIPEYLSEFLIVKNGEYYAIEQNRDNPLTFEEISVVIECIIADECKLGNIYYEEDDAPSFLKEKHPELFLEPDAPEELKNYFYNVHDNYTMTFKVIQNHKEWLPFLKDKSLKTALLRTNYLREDLIEYFLTFGDETAIKLGTNRAETVEEMLKAHQVDLMKRWYDKTGGKFIPDFVVMQNFRIEEADKFLVSGSNWSTLMKIKSFAQTPEARDAVLKLAYSFGAFDQDQRGFKKLQELLTSIPKKIEAEQGFAIEKADNLIDWYLGRDDYFVQTSSKNDPNYQESYKNMIEGLKNHPYSFNNAHGKAVALIKALEQEYIDIDYTKCIFAQLYKANDDGSYTLTINQQSCPKTIAAMRDFLSAVKEFPIITPDRAHKLFGGFSLKYDADFREFLLKKIEEIIEKPEYTSLIASIQKQFDEIKIVNSNRALTLELAISYIQSNKYSYVNPGNEGVAEISAIAGYTQNDFNILQQIYNYGKQRIFSSIPRIEKSIEKTSGKYTYEMLRLDDPLAMAIGTLSDCCQELNDCAEVCMEHSMVDKNGRVFVIKDEQGNVVAQSWIWRNKGVVCFDNIEIPDKAFSRAQKNNLEIGRQRFTDDVYEIYKQAAKELMEEDEKVYKELLDSGKITEEQYDGLRIGKVTVGSGYNDIAESLKTNAELDNGFVTRPLPFKEPVRLSRGLYTSDSEIQYVLEKDKKYRTKFEGETLSVYNDTYVEYNDSNFTEAKLRTLERLAFITHNTRNNLDIFINEDEEEKQLVTKIAENYYLNPETTRIVMNPNFAIIYDINDDELKIADLLFNTKIDNGRQQMDIENQVVMQIRLALDQISSGIQVDISDLNEEQLKMYEKARGLINEMDIERGIGRAR